MRKRPICAAAQDDLGGSDESDEGSGAETKLPPAAKKPLGSRAVPPREDGEQSHAASAPGTGTAKSSSSREVAEDVAETGASGSNSGSKRKKEKEFAWMDSEEEEADGKPGSQARKEAEEAERARRRRSRSRASPQQAQKRRSRSRERRRTSQSRRRSRSRKAKEKKEASDAEENQDVSGEVLDQVQSFGKMMILAPALQKKLKRMSPENVAAACRAMGRTRFFDGDILRDLHDVVKRLLQRDQLTAQQANDAVQCLWEINSYSQPVLGALATSFKAKVGSLEPVYRQMWLEIFKSFKHDEDKDFQQLLETPPLTSVSPGYQKIRCFHHSKGFCAVGEKACTYSHDQRAPLSLEMSFGPVRSSPLVMTQNQYTMGRTIYGGAKNGIR
eukprot:TRINITY_DN16763_c0_g1_i1.p1 TRINITY_DN16763_c0_g1~~TRINITY_DN16763_c0_g1_i1.p1  ORF type:complete len:387 (+),score=91.49 TRINITY_DN16763_c0_g1_i1:59-1219(+)